MVLSGVPRKLRTRVFEMTPKRMFLVLCLLALESRCQEVPTAQVQLRQGNITGIGKDIGNGRRYYSFKSIPYAQAPVGHLRFSDPVPAGGWTQTRDGSVTPPQCPQLNLVLLAKGTVEVVGLEDCLYLNVYTPRPFASDLPVMVQIHGGAFLIGDVRDTSPEPLLREDIVLVTFHYRLGTLGFLSTEDSVIPGNFGLKDQTLALRWVQENIRAFGGDPSKVTVFGTSAGAVSTHIQVLTPYAKGLFSKAILQSGTALCSWGLRKGHRQVAAAVGNILRCPGVGGNPVEGLDSTALLRCLQETPVEKLVPVTTYFVEWSNEPLVMLPRIDGDYLPDDPASLLKEKRFNEVDLITGINAQDGSITTNSLYFRDSLRESLVQNFSQIGPLVMNFRDGDENPEYLARRVFRRYLGDVGVTNANVDAVTQLFTDRLFATCSDLTASLHARHGEMGRKVYMYELHHRGQYKYLPAFNTSITDRWVGHGDDLQYLFDSVGGRQPLQRPSDLVVRNLLVKLWTNFAATGDPTPVQSFGFRWLPVTGQCLRYLRVQPDADMEPDRRIRIRAFWENLPTVQNKILYPERFSPFYNPAPQPPLSC